MAEVEPVAAVVPPQQPQERASFFSVAKGLIVRALIIYFISSFFRRPQPTQTPTDVVHPPKPPAVNYFPEAAEFVSFSLFFSLILFPSLSKKKCVIVCFKALSLVNNFLQVH